MNINGFEFNIDEKTVKEVTDMAVKNLAGVCAASALLHFVTDVLVNGIFAKKSTEIIIDGDFPAKLMTLGGKDQPNAVYITNRKHNIHIAPALIYGLTALAASAYLGRKEKSDKDFVIL